MNLDFDLNIDFDQLEEIDDILLCCPVCESEKKRRDTFCSQKCENKAYDQMAQDIESADVYGL